MTELVVTNNNDSGVGSLRDTIAKASAGDIITFSPDLEGRNTILLTTGEIEIPVGKDIVIEGSDNPNLIISGNNDSRIFAVDSTSANPTELTLKNLTLNEGYTSERGGAIKTEHQTILNIDNVSFNDNIADQGGGAIFSAFEGNLTVSNSTFNRNKAVAGNDERGAGAIAFWGPNNLTITNSDFVENEGINGAAINSLNGNLTIENSNFIDNDTTAAFYDMGKLRPFLRGFGGAIYTDRASTRSDDTSGTIQIINSVFEENQGRGEGGAAYLYTGTQDNVVIEDSIFKDNQILELPDGGNNGNGGAIVQMNNGLNQGFDIINTAFINNTANSQGGAIWMMQAPTTIANSTFSGNRAESLTVQGNGGALALYESTEITNTTFANNSAGWVGGAISASPSAEVKVKNTIFSNNTAENGLNDWDIKQQTGRELIDLGGNIQWPEHPDKATENVTFANPKLDTLQEIEGTYIYPLLGESSAIDAGVSVTLSTDQRGQTRPIDGDNNGIAEVDSGAFELVEAFPSPEIEVFENTTNIEDNIGTFDFGTTIIETPVRKTFTIQNSGTAELTLSNLELPTGFSLVDDFPTILAEDEEATFEIELDTTTADNFSGELSFETNDPDENPFNFTISAVVVSELELEPVPTPTPEAIPTPEPIFPATPNPVPTPEPEPTPEISERNNSEMNDSEINNDNCVCEPFPSLNLEASRQVNTIQNTQNGTSDIEIFIGSANNDSFNGLGGDDTLFGLGNSDNLEGDSGNDVLFGSQGNDFLNGGEDLDTLYAGRGNDTLFGGDDADNIWGDVGRDSISGGDGNDLLFGNSE
ncbi:MAG: choice-of-anchor D domain-containing protein, partial [Cyanobacteriota bacterium]|nr:choice-of-anchor D domain-containing protein [Cyanobacteriota bacterium]